MSADTGRRPSDAPGNILRGLRTAVLLSFSADRQRARAVLLMFVVRPLLLVLGTVWLALIVDAVRKAEPATVTWLAVASAATVAVTAVAARIGLNLSAALVENTGRHVDRRLQELAHNIPGIGHYETPAYLERMEFLRLERPRLTEGVDALGLELGILGRAAATAVLLADISPWLLLLPVVALASLFTSSRAERLRQRAISDASADVRRATDLFRLATEPEAAAELRLFGLASRIRQLHAESLTRADRISDRASLRGLMLSALGWLIFSAGYISALLLVIFRYNSGGASLGQVVLAVMLITTLNLQVNLVVRYTIALLQCARAGRQFNWLADMSAHAMYGGSRRPPDRLISGISLKNVSFRYPGTSRYVLENLSITIPAGTIAAIVGDNGAGKSTIVKLLSGLYPPTDGQILVDGIDLPDLDLGAWREAITASFQDFARLEFRLREAVGLGDLTRITDDGSVLAAMETAAATEVLESLPDGLATPLGRSFTDGAEPSGGQWQRIALARSAMRREPLLILLDEPTSAIDAVAEQALLERSLDMMRDIISRSGTVAIIVSHRLSTLRDADLVLLLSDGKLQEMGTHDELLACGGRYASLFHLQARAYQ